MALVLNAKFDLGVGAYGSTCLWVGSRLFCAYQIGLIHKLAMFSSANGVLTKVAEVTQQKPSASVLAYKAPFLFIGETLYIEAIKVIGDTLTQNALWCSASLGASIRDFDIDANWFLHCSNTNDAVRTIRAVSFTEIAGFSIKPSRDVGIFAIHGVMVQGPMVLVCGSSNERIRALQFDPVTFTYTQITNASPINTNVALCMAYIAPYYYVSENSVFKVHALSLSGATFSLVSTYVSPNSPDSIISESGRIYTCCFLKSRLEGLEWDSGILTRDSFLLGYGAPGGHYNILTSDNLGYIYWVQFDRYVYSAKDTGFILANFTADVVTGNNGLDVHFTDTSIGATSWEWDFGDGTTSTEQNPVHSYDPGTYTVTLTINGGASSKTSVSLISVYGARVFLNPSSGKPPLKVAFSTELYIP